MAANHDYIKPRTIDETLSVLKENPLARVLAGGTDILLQIQKDKYRHCLLVDINDLNHLAGISCTATGLWIGAATRLSEVVKSDQLTGAFQVLRQAASLIGSPQIRNMATIGGNLCNASPSADMSAPLIVLDAQAEIMSVERKRVVPLTDFFSGPSKNILKPGEMLAGLQIPLPARGAAAVYHKHSTRRAMDLAVVGVSVMLWCIDGDYHARIGLSAVAPTPIRARRAEQLISGVKDIDAALISQVAMQAVGECNPISDVRASAEYRRAMVAAMTKKALEDGLQQLG